jgi:8-oxo-dGTP diphosphatase
MTIMIRLAGQEQALIETAVAPRAFIRHSIHMTDSAEIDSPILAAGGVVLRGGFRPHVAIVRLRRDKAWVLPKGKLYPGERAVTAAKREVVEETGYEVSVHEFLGSMSYPVAGKIKVVQFWHMQAVGGPVREPTSDIKAVKWLPLRLAIKALTRVHERVFLAHVGPIALKAAEQALRHKVAKTTVRNRMGERASARTVTQAENFLGRA